MQVWSFFNISCHLILGWLGVFEVAILFWLDFQALYGVETLGDRKKNENNFEHFWEILSNSAINHCLT